ncbi:MAG: hypothetical protein KKH98_15185 [Spirochaetes bacterium]|nr:hypothetical protein [Spirochaetota bacterium]
MKIRSLNAVSLSLFMLIMVLTAGIIISPLHAKKGKKESGRQIGSANGEGLAKRLKLDEKTTKEFVQIHNEVYGEKFKEKMKDYMDKMKDAERGSDEQKKIMENMQNEKKEYDTKFISEVEKSKILTEKQTKDMKKFVKEKKGSKRGGGKGKKDCKK